MCISMADSRQLIEKESMVSSDIRCTWRTPDDQELILEGRCMRVLPVQSSHWQLEIFGYVRCDMTETTCEYGVCVCVYVCMCMCVHYLFASVFLCLFVFVCVCVCVWLYVYVCARVCVCLWVGLRLRQCVRACVRIFDHDTSHWVIVRISCTMELWLAIEC